MTDAREERRTKKRENGSGTLYQRGRVWWISYQGPDGKRHAESTGDERKGVAVRMLQRRVGAREHNLPVIPKAEKLTFDDAAKAVITDFEINGKKSHASVERKITKHLTPYFTGRRMAGITASDVAKYVAHRQSEGIVSKTGVRIADVSNSEINRELALLKRIFSLAIKSGRIAMRPHIPMLKEPPPRSGFFERHEIASVVAHLPTALKPVVEFAYATGWRVDSEVLPLEWRNVDFKAGEVRLDAGTTKNGQGRVFPMTAALRQLLQGQQKKHTALKRAGHIVPNVFWRMVAKGRGGEKQPKPIKKFIKAWRKASIAAGYPGRIPHDMRRSAVRNLVRAAIPERVAMRMTGHLTRSVFERYNIVSDGDLHDAAQKLDAVVSLKRTAQK